MYKNTPYKTAKGTCSRAAAKTTEIPTNNDTAKADTR
jgi:hypothetical protein